MLWVTLVRAQSSRELFLFLCSLGKNVNLMKHALSAMTKWRYSSQTCAERLGKCRSRDPLECSQRRKKLGKERKCLLARCSAYVNLCDGHYFWKNISTRNHFYKHFVENYLKANGRREMEWSGFLSNYLVLFSRWSAHLLEVTGLRQKLAIEPQSLVLQTR